MKLNAKQKRFCEEYIIDGNARQASIRAGYSKNTASEIGYEHLIKPHIMAYVKELQDKIADSRILKSQEIQVLLSERIQEGLDGDGLKAVDILNKMQGNYALDKVGDITVRNMDLNFIDADK